MKLTERSKQTNKKNTFIKKKTKIRSPLLEQYMLLFIIAVSLSLNYIHIFFISPHKMQQLVFMARDTQSNIGHLKNTFKIQQQQKIYSKNSNEL